MSWDIQQFAALRPFISINRTCFQKTNKERGQIITAKKLHGKTKHHKFVTVTKGSF